MEQIILDREEKVRLATLVPRNSSLLDKQSVIMTIGNMV